MYKRIVAIYVETPYQLITSLNIAKNYLGADGCVLFLMEQYYMTDRKFQLRGTHPFIKGIYYIQEYVDVGAFRHHFLRVKGLLKGYPSKDYPNMLCYYKTRPQPFPHFDALICNKYEERLARQYIDILHRKADVYIIEDGTGDYVNPITEIDSRFQRIYYWPELFNKTYGEKVLQAPRISLSDIEIKKIFCDVFRLPKSETEKISNCKCIYFHQPRDRENDELADKVHENELEIIETLKKKYGDSFFMKLHPRDDLSIFPDIQKINSDVPWEAMLYYLSDISNTVLVGLHSTTLFTSKCSFNEEPYIITTTNMFDYWKMNNTDEFINRIESLFLYLKNSYSDTSKVMRPLSIEEMSKSLDMI